MSKVRYTKGPETLTLGVYKDVIVFKRGEWKEVSDKKMVDQALLPGRVEEYGFEIEKVKGDSK